MKFDMHCHTKEGSIDAKVDVESYINILISKGYDGMLVSDHNSYRGYYAYEKIAARLATQTEHPFTVLKGIEYDTWEGGHILVILPDGVDCRLMAVRGMRLPLLEKIVHDMGGICGPAHPYGTGFFAIMNTKFGKMKLLADVSKSMIGKFDFIETFNACNLVSANTKADELACHYGKTKLAGSDAHKADIIGSAYTIFEKDISCNNDLIAAVKSSALTQVGGDILEKYQKRNPILKHLGIVGYWLYNKTCAILCAPLRFYYFIKDSRF